MENISKALLIAAGVLIALLILSLGVYLFAYFGGKSSEINQQVDEQKIVEFNTKFTQFDGREDITIYEIVSLINYAYENNDYYKNYGNYEDEYQILVKINGEKYCYKEDGKIKNPKTTTELINIYNSVTVKGELEDKNLFKVAKIEYNVKGKINFIEFSHK